MVESGVMEDYTYLWYDVRPHPKFGTVEIRACDSQTRVEHTLGLAALIQAMVKELAEHFDAGDAARATTRGRCSTRTSGSPRATASTASSSTCPTNERVPTKELARRLLDRLREHAAGPRLGRRPRRRSRTSLARGNGRPPPARRLRGQPRPARGHGGNRRGDGPRPEHSVYDGGAWPPALSSSSSARTAGRRSARTSPSARTAGSGCASARRRSSARGRRPSAERRTPPTPVARAAAHRRDPRHPRRRAAPAGRDDRARGASAACGGWRSIPLRDEGVQLVVDPLGEWWQVLTAPFVHVSGWYQFAALGAVGIFGWVLERRHGPAAGARSSGCSPPRAAWRSSRRVPERGDGRSRSGASGGALGLLCAWAVPDPARAPRAGGERRRRRRPARRRRRSSSCSRSCRSRATRSARSRRSRGIVVGVAVRAACSPRAAARATSDADRARLALDEAADDRARHRRRRARRAPPRAGRPRSSRRRAASGAPARPLGAHVVNVSA